MAHHLESAQRSLKALEYLVGDEEEYQWHIAILQRFLHMTAEGLDRQCSWGSDCTSVTISSESEAEYSDVYDDSDYESMDVDGTDDEGEVPEGGKRDA